MSINPLIPIAGAYAIEAARQLAQPLSAGASFAQTLLAGSGEPKAAGAPKAIDTVSTFRFDRAGQVGPTATSDNSGPTRTPGVSPDLQRKLDEFQTLLGQRMLAAGLDPFESMRLQSDALGGLELVADHPNATEIETLLTRDPALARAFQELVELFQQLHTSTAAPSASVTQNDSRFGLGSWKQTAGTGRTAAVEFAFDRENINVSVSG